jgi:hypothetical protein
MNLIMLSDFIQVLHIKSRHSTKNTKVQEVYSLSSSNEEGNDSSSSDDESIQAKKDNGKKKNGAKPSHNTTSFNYASLPSNHSFTSVLIGKPHHFDGMNYIKWCHAMKVHLMSLNLNIWKVVCTSVEFLKDCETPDYNQLQ